MSLYVYQGVVDRWVDADTVDIHVDLGFRVYIHERFRLSGIDAWENRGEERPWGLKATERVNEVAPVGTRVLIHSEKAGKYGRWLAEIFLPSENGTPAKSINEMLLEEGHAVPYGGK